MLTKEEGTVAGEELLRSDTDRTAILRITCYKLLGGRSRTHKKNQSRFLDGCKGCMRTIPLRNLWKNREWDKMQGHS